MKKLYFFPVFVLTFWLIAAHVKCDCADITECPAALKYLEDVKNHVIHSSSIKVLRDAICGSSLSDRKVRCERVPACYQPTDQNFCTKATDCCVATRLLKWNITQNAQALAIIRESQCGLVEGSRTVKCGRFLEAEDLLLENFFEAAEDVCITPSGQKGRCIALELCPILSGKPITENYIDTLKRSICDYRNRRVCCGRQENLDHVCGVDNQHTDKISGGVPTEENEYPWVVILKYQDSRLLCGGSLINSQFVITAGHCIQKGLIKVQFGGHGGGNLLEFKVLHKRKHQLYTRRPLKHDIGLLKIQKVNYQDKIKWICLPLAISSLPDKFIVSGNGLTEKGTLSKQQLKAQLPRLDASVCASLFKKSLDDQDTIICAGGEVGVDACPGDSGGPLMSKGDISNWQLFGLVSGGSIDCSSGSPGLYTRVDKYLSWIHTTMNEMLKT